MIFKSKVAKIAAGFVGFAFVVGIAVTPVTSVHGQTSADLSAQINALLAQIAQLQGQVSGSTSHTFNADLTVGSTGSDVVALQQVLVEKGYLTMPAGVSMGTFGPLTAAAVKAWQAAAGLPTTGYFGPLSRAKLNSSTSVTPGTTLPAGCTSTSGFSSTTGRSCNSTTPTTTAGLEGTDGTIEDVNVLSQYSNEEVGDGESDVKIMGFEVQASNDGDIALKNVKLVFDPSGNGSGDSDHLDDYIDAVTVWMGTTEIGSADAGDFTKNDDDTYSKTITLRSGTVVRSDETEKFYVSIDSANNLDSGDIDSDSWTVGLDSIRFEDGSGVVTTEDTAGDLGSSDLTVTAAGTGGVGINFVTFSTAANTELKVSTASDSPEAGIVVIDDSDTTDDVVLLKGKLRVDGDSNVVIDSIPVTLTSTGASVSSITGSVKLSIGGEEYTESVATSTLTGYFATGLAGTITFDNLDLTIDAGDTVEFTVSADINDTDSSLPEGSTLKASLTSGSTGNVGNIDAENEEGDQLDTSSERSGSSIGEAQEFRTNGVSLTLVTAGTSVAAGNSTNDDLGTFTLRFKVTAVGDTVYVSTLADATLSGVTAGKTSVHVDRAGTATVGGTSVTITNLTDTDTNTAGLYTIEDGESETFEVTTTVQLPTAGVAGQFRVVLGGVSWTTDSTDPTPDNAYTSNLDDFKTSYVGLN